MAQVLVRNLEQWVVDALKLEAELKGCSLEAYLREALAEEALRRRRQIAREARELREEMAAKYGSSPVNAVQMIRDVRDDK